MDTNIPVAILGPKIQLGRHYLSLDWSMKMFHWYSDKDGCYQLILFPFVVGRFHNGAIY